MFRFGVHGVLEFGCQWQQLREFRRTFKEPNAVLVEIVRLQLSVVLHRTKLARQILQDALCVNRNRCAAVNQPAQRIPAWRIFAIEPDTELAALNPVDDDWIHFVLCVKG